MDCSLSLSCLLSVLIPTELVEERREEENRTVEKDFKLVL